MSEEKRANLLSQAKELGFTRSGLIKTAVDDYLARKAKPVN